ncbi:hypothetical protein [Planifilum fimeticola]
MFRLADGNQSSAEVLYRLLEAWMELEPHILALSHPQWGGRCGWRWRQGWRCRCFIIWFMIL